MRAFIIGLAATTLILPKVLLAAVPPAPQPPGFIPGYLKAQFTLDYESNLSQVFGQRVTITLLHTYTEQDGSSTLCTAGVVGGRRFRIAKGNGIYSIQPNATQWADAGCTRRGYDFFR